MKALVFLLAAGVCAFGQATGTDIPGLQLQKDKAAAPAAPAAPAGRGGRGAPVIAGRAGAASQGVDKPGPARTASTSGSPRDLKFPPLHQVQPPKLITATLPNGMKVFLAEQRELPVIGGAIMVRTGGALDPPERIGLAELAGSLLRSGGTAVKTGEQVDETVTRLGMTLESNFSESAGVLTFTGLRRNAEPSLALLREILVQPEFRLDRLELAKSRIRNAVAHRNDEIPVLMRRELTGIIFGKTSPYGRQPDYAGLDRITRTDLKNFHRRYFFPGNVMLGIWGDFDAVRMQAVLEKVFGGWSSTQEAVAAFPKATATPTPGLHLGEDKNVQVSHIMVGQPGGTVAQKDYPALEVMGKIFSQLQERITRAARSGAGNVNFRGVTVDDVKADWGAGYDRPGIFQIYGTCRGAATAEALKAIQADIERIRTVEVADEELRVAKEAALAALSAEWDTNDKAFVRVMTQEYYGLPRDFAQQYQAGIAAVTRADVLRVAKQYLNPAMLTTVVIGNPQVFTTPLEKVSPQVTRIDLTVPQPKPSVSESTDTSISEGKRLLQRAQAAVGGTEKLAAVNDYILATEYQIDPSVAEIGGAVVPQSDRWVSPTAFRQELSLPTGRITAYSDGRGGWVTSRQGWAPLTGVQLKQMQGDLFRSYFRLLLSDRLEGRTVNAADQNLVEITDTAGQIIRMEFDPETGLPRRATYDAPHAGGAPLFTEEVFSDFREVSGIKFPYKILINQTGRRFADVVVKDLKINSGMRQIELALRPQ